MSSPRDEEMPSDEEIAVAVKPESPSKSNSKMLKQFRVLDFIINSFEIQNKPELRNKVLELRMKLSSLEGVLDDLEEKELAAGEIMDVSSAERIALQKEADALQNALFCLEVDDKGSEQMPEDGAVALEESSSYEMTIRLMTRLINVKEDRIQKIAAENKETVKQIQELEGELDNMAGPSKLADEQQAANPAKPTDPDDIQKLSKSGETEQ